MTEIEHDPTYMYSSTSHSILNRPCGDLMHFPPSELPTLFNHSETESLLADEYEVQQIYLL